MKFLYFGDRHNTFKNPSNRLDDYQQTCLNKDLEIIDIGKKNNVTAFLHPGDFWNEKEIKGENKFIDSIINRWGMINIQEVIKDVKSNSSISSELLDKINNYIPLVGIIGNHDLIGNSLDTLPDTTMGFLASMGQTTLVTKENPIFFTTEDGLKVAITGTHYHLHMDEPSYINDYIVTEKLGDIHIHIVHGMLSEKDLGPLIKHTTIDSIKETKADITLCGHNHIGFGILNVDNKYFINIGSVTRISNNLKEIVRKPSIALIDISKKGIHIEEIPLKSAEDGVNVLDRTAIESTGKKKKVIQTFKDEINSLKDSETKMSIKTFVESVATAKSIDDDTKKDILNRIVVKESENAKIKAMKVNAYISEIILENFQSHKFSHFVLDKHFNVIIGESRQGKSAIQRAIYWVYENKPSGSNFVKRGEDYAKVTIILSNNTIVSRYIESKKNGKNRYEIMYPDGTVESGNTTLLPLVQRVLGFNYLFVDKKLSLPVNFYKQGESWYLIGNGISSTDKARIIGSLNGTNVSDAIVRDLDAENNRIITLNKVSVKKTEELNQEIEKFNEWKDIKIIIDKNELLIQKYELLKIKRESISKLLGEINEKKNSLKEAKNDLTNLKDIDKVINQLKTLKEKVSLHKDINNYNNNYKESSANLIKYSELKENLKNLTDINTKINIFKVELDKYTKTIEQKEKYINLQQLKESNKIVIDKTKDLQSIRSNIENIKLLMNNYVLINNEKSKYINYNKGLLGSREVIHNTDNLENVYLLLQNYETIETLKENLHDKINNYKNNKDKIDKLKESIIDIDKDISNKKNEYKNVLKESNICPICKSELDEGHINNIIHN